TLPPPPLPTRRSSDLLRHPERQHELPRVRRAPGQALRPDRDRQPRRQSLPELPARDPDRAVVAGADTTTRPAGERSRGDRRAARSEEHTSELQSRENL